MRHRWLSTITLGVATLAVLAWSATPASAQRWGWGGGGWYGGRGYWGGYGSYPYGNYYGSYGYYGQPYYGGYTSYYSPSGYGWGACDCCGSSDGYAYGGTPGGYSSFYSGPTGDNANAARMNIRVPADARVFFDGEATNQGGEFRQFVSPALEPNHKYTYEVRATWMENGRTVDRTRKLDVRPGQSLNVDFLAMGGRGDERGDINAPPRPEERRQHMPRPENPEQNKPPR